MNARKIIIRIPLFWKFAFLSALLVVVFGSINIYQLWSSVYKSFEQEIDKRCVVLGKITAEKTLNAIVYNDELSLYSTISSIKASDNTIAYIFILNNLDEVIAHSNGFEIPAHLVKANKLNKNDYNIKVLNIKTNKLQVIRDIAFPILNGDVGIIRIGIVEENIQQEMNEATRKLLIMILIFFVIGLFGSLLFAYVITSPIKQISIKAQTIDLNNIENEDCNFYGGQKRGIFSVYFTDELDSLLSKFSEMLYRLKNNYIKLKETQNALIRAEKLASLGTLSAGVAHEINNPISGIMNCANRILKNPENIERSREYALLIKEASEKIENVVQHLLNFSRKEDLKLSKTVLNDVVQVAITITGHKLKANHIEVINKQNDTYFVNGSASYLEQVFVNLLFNSMDAIVEKKEKIGNFDGRISILMERIENHVSVHFVDNGIGIPLAAQKQIFDPFFTSKKVGKGTGLGLSVSFSIIGKHNGSIQLRKSNAEQTEFVIKLPCFCENNEIDK